jgi:hypothetical protein
MAIAGFSLFESVVLGQFQKWASEILATSSVGWWLMAGADLF